MIEGGLVMLLCGVLLSIVVPAERAMRRRPDIDRSAGRQLRAMFPLPPENSGLVQLAHEADEALTHRAT